MSKKQKLQRLLSLWTLLSLLTKAETRTGLVRKCCETNQMIGQFWDCTERPNLNEDFQSRATFCAAGKISGCQRVSVSELNYFSRCRNRETQSRAFVKEFLANGSVTGEFLPQLEIFVYSTSTFSALSGFHRRH